MFIQKFYQTIEFRDGKYHVELPWYENILKEVPSNFHVALATLRGVKRRLEKQGLTSAYGDVFKQYQREGIIEPIQISSENIKNFKFVPHRAVIKTAAQVTTKIRPVFNCSLRVGGSPSLNQASYHGVDLLNSLFRLLISFRTNKYVVLADISKAFLQIRLKLEEDKNRFCFLWEENDQIVAYRYTTIIFGLAVSPFVLNAVIHYHADQYPSDLCSFLLKNNLYVDNFCFTHSSEDVLRNIAFQAISRMKEGGFDLSSWNTNNPGLRDLFEEEGKLSAHQCAEERVLGYLYEPQQDTIKLSEVSFQPISTKRQLLSEVSKLFDPLALFIPVSIRGRLLMKKTWEKEMKWDDEVNPDIKASWEKLRKDLSGLSEITFLRSCFETSDKDLSINIFCDASTHCFGFVVYISSNLKGPQILWAKGKVAPLKGRTLPCLELMSIFLALKCLPSILKSFPDVQFQDLNIFSDSQISLQWVLNKGQKNKQIFVRNRIQDITLMVTSLKNEFSLHPKFLYVRSEENPADLLTRGITLSEFKKKFQFWSSGPEWLASHPSYWPSFELRNAGIEPVTPVFVAVREEKEPPVINISKYSSLNFLLRVCALLFRFLAKTRDVCSNIDCDERALLYCLKIMQQETFATEISFLKRIKVDPSTRERPPDLVNRLNLFLDDNDLLRTKGRLARSNFYEVEVLNPILLHKNHHLTSLIVRDAHFECKHLGIQATLTRIRLRGFWITSARGTIKRILSDCVVCKKFNIFAFQYPKFTNFSKAQVDLFRPFKHVGVDFTKHWWVKTQGSNQSQKMFLIIYTCLHIRAIYLDLVPDMTAKSFVQSFQRFINVHGVPDTVYSDNARTFSLGTDAMESFIASEEGKELLRKNHISHKRVANYSPWAASLWERLLRTVKGCLYKTIGRSSLEYFNFITILSDIVNAINERPLTYTSSDNDVLPLTPNCFLKPHSRTSIILPGHSSGNPLWNSSSKAREDLIKSLRVASEKFEEFRTRWYNEYMLSLREISRDLYQSKWENRVKVDDVILIKSPVKERPFWQMGIVTQLLPGDDGKVRFVYVKNPGGQINLYPIKLLYPLELSLTHNVSRKDSVVSSSSDTPPAVVNNPPTTSGQTSSDRVNGGRPVRKAALAARRQFVYSSDESEEESDY